MALWEVCSFSNGRTLAKITSGALYPSQHRVNIAHGVLAGVKPSVKSIYADPKYEDGYYSFSEPPATGLGAARMAALLTYRSRNSFEARFGRNIPNPARRQTIRETPPPTTPSEAHFQIHNDGHKITRLSPKNGRTNLPSQLPNSNEATAKSLDPQFSGPKTGSLTGGDSLPSSTYFSAQSYLRYQGEKICEAI